jgi:hypothetical protein
MPKSTEVAANISATTAVAPAETDDLPDLYGPVSRAADIQLPEVRVMADLSDAVKARIARPGDVLRMMGSDDPDPVFLISEERGLTSFNAYLIARSRFAATTDSKRIIFQRERDPDDPDSWEGYFYTLAMPEIDPDVPARVMAWKTAWKVFIRKANFFIAKSMKEGGPPPHVKVTIQKKVSTRGFDYYSPQPQLIPADDGLAAALEMQKFAASVAWENDPPTEAADFNDLPAI